MKYSARFMELQTELEALQAEYAKAYLKSLASGRMGISAGHSQRYDEICHELQVEIMKQRAA